MERSAGGPAPARDAPVRVHRVTATLALAFAADLTLSPRLWLSSRTYPLAPVWDALPPIPFPWDLACLATLFGLLVTILVVPRPRLCLVLLVGFTVLYSLWDQARWTPPVYQYTFMLAALAGHAWSRPGPGTGVAALNACRVVVAGTYLWAGVSKVSVTFVWATFPWMVEPVVGKLPDAFRGWPFPLGLAAALAEAGIGLGLLLPVTRRFAVVGAMLMHALILVAIGPLGHRWDTTVWPWNVAMPFLAVFLFWHAGDTTVGQILMPRRLGLHGVAVVLFLVMPVLGLFDLWDAYLSAQFYTGAIPLGTIRMSPDVASTLPPEIRRHVRPDADGAEVLDLMDWAFADRNVEPYPAPRVFKATARALCRQVADRSMMLVVQGKAHWRTGRRQVARYSCRDLLPTEGGNRPSTLHLAAQTGRLRLGSVWPAGPR